MTINEWCREAEKIATDHGFIDAPIYERLMLVVTEVAEAAEDVRHNRMDHFPEELADICIRVFHLAAAEGIDLEAAITATGLGLTGMGRRF